MLNRREVCVETHSVIGQLARNYFNVLMTFASLDDLTTVGIWRMRKAISLHLRELWRLN